MTSSSPPNAGLSAAGFQDADADDRLMGRRSRRPRRTARLILALGLAAVGLWIARDFLLPLGWALVLAIAIWPLYRWVTTRGWLGSGSVLPPLVFTSLIGLILVVPLGFAAFEVGRGGQAAVEWLRAARENGIPAPAWLGQIPAVGDWAVGWWREHLARPEQANALLGSIDVSSLADWSKTFAAAFMSRAFVFFISMLALFFLFRNGAWLGDRLLDHADRLFGDPGEKLAARMVAAARGTFNGTVLVALGEGMLIGIGYFLTGVPRPMLFTALTIAVAMLPFGAWLAFTTASLLLLAQGAGFLFAGLLFGWGALVMLAGDNFVQPVLVGGSVRLPFLWALIGILGGIQTLGLLGLFLGPVIMAALMTIWREWIDRTQTAHETAR
jgi:predicted PurR-regulated permease PerM